MQRNREQVNENSLISFLKDNEYLFTILGVFLVLAFIFNSPQVISFVNPQSQSTNVKLNLQCSSNGTDLISKTYGNNSNTQFNCTGNTITNSQMDSGKDSYSNTTRSFSFICLLMALIIYLIICYNLYLSLRECIIKIATYLKRSVSSAEIIRDCMILFVIPFIFQGAIMFGVLLITLYPDMIANAFFSTSLTLLLIEFFVLVGIVSELERAVQNQHSKRKSLILSVIFFGIGIFSMVSSFFLWNDLTVLLSYWLLSIIFIAFGIKGILWFIQNRNTIEVHEVI